MVLRIFGSAQCHHHLSQDNYNLNAERGNSDFDIRHRFSLIFFTDSQAT